MRDRSLLVAVHASRQCEDPGVRGPPLFAFVTVCGGPEPDRIVRHPRWHVPDANRHEIAGPIAVAGNLRCRRARVFVPLVGAYASDVGRSDRRLAARSRP